MSVVDHFDALLSYGATAYRIVPTEGEPEDLVGEGGGLQAAFEEQGQRQLLGVLRDAAVHAVMLADGDLAVEAERTSTGARLVVRWGETTVLEETVEIPPMRSSWPGPWFRPAPDSEVTEISGALADANSTLYAVAEVGGRLRWYTDGFHGRGVGELPLRGTVGGVAPASLGSAAFRATHGVRSAYVAGAMAGGIASADLVIAMSEAGLLSFFGSGGLPVDAVEAALETVSATLGDGPWGFNLLHNPVEPEVEEQTVDLYLKYGVRKVSASAYMGLTPAVVRYRLAGIHQRPDGTIVCPNAVFAKVSRPEVAERFLRPAPDDVIAGLVEAGHLGPAEAAMAKQVPVAEDITAEADSGGHTDHRPLLVLLPELQRLRDRVSAEEGYGARGCVPRVGAAGGLGTPAAVWAAFAMGADYVLTGSVNQASVEAGTSPLAKEMLTKASFFDVATGPAPDMFEIGAKVQVLSRGSMYAQRAQRLYDLYKRYDSLEAIPDRERQRIEKQMFKADLDEIWSGTRAYWQDRDPKQVEKAERDGRHKMALTFRWYLGMTSRWARTGEGDRKRDFQVWCGPAMGGFNGWANGSALEPLAGRGVVAIADALLHGAAVHARIASARVQGLELPVEVDSVAASTARSHGVEPVADG